MMPKVTSSVLGHKAGADISRISRETLKTRRTSPAAAFQNATNSHDLKAFGFSALPGR
jgi:hypothetical protein